MRDKLAQNNRADAFYAAMADVPPQFQSVIKAKRVQAPRQENPEIPYEAEILAQILSAIRARPDVAICDRRQSGVFQDGNRMIRVGSRGVLDISGMMQGGRYFEIEAKRPGKKPTDEQADRIDVVRAGGGIAGVAYSAADAMSILDDSI